MTIHFDDNNLIEKINSFINRIGLIFNVELEQIELI